MEKNSDSAKIKAKTAFSPHGMVSTASRIATAAGVRMLARGGNAFDAAVAAAFCLGVTEPQASGLGGQSMVLLHHYPNGEASTAALDGSSRAPFGIDPNSLPEKPFKLGVTATTVPSTPATLGYLLDTYGTMSIAEVLEPAIVAAGEGFKLSALQHKLVTRESERMQDEAVRRVFFKNGRPLNAGDIVYQPQLAACLERIAAAGWRDFYLGEIGEAIIKDMEGRGGFIGRADMSQVPLPIQREVLTGSYRGYALATFPPPGAGRALVQILNTLEHLDQGDLQPDAPLYYLLLALTFRAALMNRERFPIDPALYPQFADQWMVDKESAERLSSRISSLVQYLSKEQLNGRFAPPPTSGETTHLSAADRFGNCVGITQSIELVFGAKTMASGLGFFYNNYMSAFEYKNMMHPSFLVPGGRPYSSVAPTLLFRESGRPYIMLGSPGSERISTTLAQVISRMIDSGQGLAEAIDGPRIHAGSSGKAAIEKRSFRPEISDLLSRAGFSVKSRGAYSFYIGCVQAVELPEAEGEDFKGVSDPRRDGNAGGPHAIASREEEEQKNENSDHL